MSVTDVPRLPFIRPGATSPLTQLSATVTSSSTYTTMTSSTTGDLLLAHVGLSTIPDTSVGDYEIRIAVGAAASEVIVARWTWAIYSFSSVGKVAAPFFALPCQVIIPSGSRVSAYISRSATENPVVYAECIKTAQLTYTL